jgi:hypothetical protein
MIGIYVWRGPSVLKNYSSGLVVVAAESPEDAWKRLREADFNAYFCLQTGVSWIHSEDELSHHQFDPSELRPPIEPEIFAPENLPVLVKHGGD